MQKYGEAAQKAAYAQRADTSVGPYRGAKLFGVLVGLRMFVACSGRGMPRPYKNERSVTWRSDLFIDFSFTKTNMRIPGPGPQARCGKGVWSPEDQGGPVQGPPILWP